MGGFGSGRTPKNRLSNSYHQLTVRRLERLGGLVSGKTTTWNWLAQSQIVTFARITAEGSGLRVLYSWWSMSDGWTRSNWFIRLEWSDCHYGGQRPWLICPTPRCGRRMFVIYGDRDIACRTCRRFSYPSQRVAPENRALYRVQSIRQKLGGPPDLSLPFPERPVGMPSFTYTKLGLRALRAEKEANNQLIASFKHLPRPAERTAAPDAPKGTTSGNILRDES